MYCSSCGVAVATNLTYCNHCGAKLNSEKTDPLAHAAEIKYDSFIMSAMAGLFVMGLIAISILLGVMKAVMHFDFGPAFAFAFLSFLLLIGLEGILISRLFRRKRLGSEPVETGRLAAHITKELEAQSRLGTEPVSSVTDHTTRTLSPVYGRNAGQ